MKGKQRRCNDANPLPKRPGTEHSQNTEREHSTEQERSSVDDTTEDRQHVGLERETPQTEYPNAYKSAAVSLGLALSVFCVMLDKTIVSTAIPTITDEFNTAGDVGWYGSSYLLTACAFQLVFGQLYSFSSIKLVYIITFAIFQVGSLISGAAARSSTLIIGRAIAGLGAAGVLNGAILIIAGIIPLRKRPIYLSMFSLIQCVAQIVGPLLSGAFTDRLSWRFCFYLNLPLGVATLGLIFMFFNDQNTLGTRIASGWHAKLQRFDIHGTIVFLPMVVCLLLALQWGGTKYGWADARIVVLLVLTVILFVIFVRIQSWMQDRATIPPRVMGYSTVWSSAWYGANLTAALFVAVYYIPIWLQAIKNATPTQSGIMILPVILATVLAAIAAGGVATALGFYSPLAVLATITMSAGAGLLTTLEPQSQRALWIGSQAVFGLGVGLGTQLPMLAIQTNVQGADVPIATSICTFSQMLGGSIAVSVAQNVFAKRLFVHLQPVVPALDAKTVISAGITELPKLVGSDKLQAFRQAYNHAIAETFYVAVAFAVMTVLGCHFSEGSRIIRRLYPGKAAVADGQTGAEDGIELAAWQPDRSTHTRLKSM